MGPVDAAAICWAINNVLPLIEELESLRASRKEIMSTKEHMMPVQGDHLRPAGQVPESVARLAYRSYKKLYGDRQSFETLHRRGGFSWDELVAGILGPEILRRIYTVPVLPQEIINELKEFAPQVGTHRLEGSGVHIDL